MNGPPNAERRRQGDHPDTGDVLTNSTLTTVRRIGPPCGDALGGPHLCGAGDPVVPSATCWQCAAMEIHELRLMGWKHGGCIHQVVAA